MIGKLATEGTDCVIRRGSKATDERAEACTEIGPNQVQDFHDLHFQLYWRVSEEEKTMLRLCGYTVEKEASWALSWTPLVPMYDYYVDANTRELKFKRGVKDVSSVYLKAFHNEEQAWYVVQKRYELDCRVETID